MSKLPDWAQNYQKNNAKRPFLNGDEVKVSSLDNNIFYQTVQEVVNDVKKMPYSR